MLDRHLIPKSMVFHLDLSENLFSHNPGSKCIYKIAVLDLRSVDGFLQEFVRHNL